MMRHAFVISGEDQESRRVPVGSVLVVGRGGSCDLVIRDLAASRQHLEIRNVDGGYVCRDLGSRNGTQVNGSAVSQCELRHGDEISIGQTVLRFELGARPEPAPPDKTVFLQTVLDPAGLEKEPPPSSRSKELLEAAYTLMNSLSSNFKPCELVDTILETTMRAVRAQRGAVLFAGDNHALEPCPECGHVHTIRDGVPRTAGLDEISISESVAQRVLRDGQNVLFQSAWADGIVDSSASIAALRLTSILCVPIRTRTEVLGILYIDTDLADHDYTEDDMLLAAAAGNSAGLALENARIHRDLLDKQRVENDIAAAWTIQESFLVADWPTDDRRLDVYGVTRPAKVVGGDFYDFAPIRNDLVGMLIGDVSGKGVPAALTMALLLAEFRLCATGAESVAALLRRLNERMVARSRRGTFCTAAIVAVDLETGRLVGANAGHHPVLRISRDGVSAFLPASGPPIGILPGVGWVDEETVIRPGETLLMYTDGIVEARSGAPGDADAEPPVEYGLEGLEAIAGRHADSAPKVLIEAVLKDVFRFASPRAPHDDCTMIALKYHGSSAEAGG
jgi:sigma-B regulation protein RsbU (phosphoserine phosphatase)